MYAVIALCVGILFYFGFLVWVIWGDEFSNEMPTSKNMAMLLFTIVSIAAGTLWPITMFLGAVFGLNYCLIRNLSKEPFKNKKK